MPSVPNHSNKGAEMRILIPSWISASLTTNMKYPETEFHFGRMTFGLTYQKAASAEANIFSLACLEVMSTYLIYVRGGGHHRNSGSL